MGRGDWTGLRYGPSWAAACKTAADRQKSQGGVEGLPQMGLAQLERKLFFLFFSFSEFNFQCENISKKS
jgi:hypothetical protein